MGIFLWDTAPSKIFVGDTQVSKVFVWDTQVRPSGWQPWANTVLYLPLNTDYSDLSSYHRVYTSQVWTMSFSSYQWVNSARFDGGYLKYPITNCDFWDFTLSFWVWMESRRNGWETFGDLHNDNVSINISPLLNNTWKRWVMNGFRAGTGTIDIISNVSFSAWWHLYTITHSNEMCRLYLDWNEIANKAIQTNPPDILEIDVGTRDDVTHSSASAQELPNSSFNSSEVPGYSRQPVFVL